MAMSADGKRRNQNKMKTNRYDRAHEGDSKKEKPETMGRDAAVEGPRAQANDIEAKSGDHEEIKQIAAEHGPAHEIHMAHDHMAKVSHVHSVHEDGHQHHAEHAGEDHVMMAHHHAMHASGVSPEEETEENEGEYPEEHKSATSDGQEDEYAAPEL
jgi:hypothetical protein